MAEDTCSDELARPRHRAQWTQQTMYRLRKRIRGNEDNVEDALSVVEKSLGEDLRAVLDEALQSKAPEDGQGLLTYAAAQGKEAWFLHIASEIRKRLGLRELVKELREVDIDGAPLLSNAAASRGEYSCFVTAFELIHKALGKSGLAEQLEAVDGNGRELLMYAARSNDPETFEKVLSICENTCMAVMKKEPSPDILLAANAPADRPCWQVLLCKCGAKKAAREAASAYALRMVLEKTDYDGMSCLHHAAEAGCAKVLLAVVNKHESVDAIYRSVMVRAASYRLELCEDRCPGGESRWLRPPLTTDFGKKDRMGRTATMLVLRNACGSYVDKNGLEAKFRMLYEKLPVRHGFRVGWMTPRRVLSVPVPYVRRWFNGKRTHYGQPTVAITELMHAARGGLVSLELALNEVPQSFKTDDGLTRTVFLDRALAVKEDVDDESSPLIPEQEAEARNWGRALLLAAAAKRGDTKVLFHVLHAIKEGRFTLTKNGIDDETYCLGDASELTEPAEDLENVKAAVEKIAESRESLFSYAVLSGETDAVQLVFDLVVKLFGGRTNNTWNILSGNDSSTASSLACAASGSMEADDYGLTMFEKVYELLNKQAVGREMCNLLRGRRRLGISSMLTPLMAAAFSSNWVIFWRVYGANKELTDDAWWYESVWPSMPPPRLTRQRSVVELYPCPHGIPKTITRGAGTIPAVMWQDIAEALKRSRWPPDMATDMREYLKGFSRRAVKVAAKRGTFTDVSNLVKEGFPLHDEYIYLLLKYIGDCELDIIQTVVLAVANASNPFGMTAWVSRMLRRAEVDYPVHKSELRRLQNIIDEFDNVVSKELLDILPQTVRGMGMALLGGQSVSCSQGLEQGLTVRLGNLAGFIVVQWILEPSLLVGQLNNERGYVPEYEDPLRRALDRGSEALDFLNSPLVKNYVHVKFTGTLPPWTSRNPFQPTVNEGFYKYEFAEYELAPLLQGLSMPARASSFPNKSPAEKERWTTMAFLLRFLQGWDHGEAVLQWNVPSKMLVGGIEDPTLETPTGLQPQQKKVPHTTILPGLQFSLAGILGKPETFYDVPVIRFVFEIFSYLVMLVLFCLSALLKEHDTVPPAEAVFYVFAAGLLWREVLEFRDGISSRWHRAPEHQGGVAEEQEHLDPDLSTHGPGENFNQIASAFSRYVFNDTWNFLDTLTISCILVAFIFRMLALNDNSFLFHAQFFFALSAPLLFSRLLVLSQIDATLGPMTQVIWRMMSQTLRFSAFIAMVMLSFALAFHAVFHTCGSHIDPDCESAVEFEFLLRDAFGTFGDSFVTVFSSALGGPDFGLFEEAGDDCSSCDLPRSARNAGRFLMVVYVVTMAVVLLNLLIAVLSTAHDEVYANAEKEFHLARTKLIHESARDVVRRRPPPPLNLVKLIFGIVVDTVNEIYRVLLHFKRFAPYVCRNGDTLETRRRKAKQYRKEATELPPFSTRPQWKAMDGFLQRLAFAATMGVAALFVSAMLWILSLPWVAWSIFRSTHPAKHRKKNRNEIADDDVFGDSSDDSDEEQEENILNVPRRVERGYFDALVSLIGGLGGGAIGTVVGMVLCLCYIAGSVLLWAAGILWLLPWLWKNRQRKAEDFPEAMPGQEGGDHWKHAWNLVKSRNHVFGVDSKHPHFNVVPFLKSKTGLNMQHLAGLTKLHDEKSKSEKDRVDVDPPIDFEHLAWKVQNRRRNTRSGDGRGRDDEGDDNSDALRGKLMEAVKNLEQLLREVEESDRRRDARTDSSEPNGVERVGGAGRESGGDTENSVEKALHA